MELELSSTEQLAIAMIKSQPQIFKSLIQDGNLTIQRVYEFYERLNLKLDSDRDKREGKIIEAVVKNAIE